MALRPRVGLALALIALVAARFAFPSTVLAPAPGETAAGLQRRGKKAPAPRLEPFVGTLAAAKHSAAERNVPLLIHIVLEGEPQNDEYRDAFSADRKLTALSERAVVIVANNGEHPRRKVKEVVEDVTIEREACSVYRWFENCVQHRENWDPLYFEYREPESGEMHCPQTVILAPDGKLAWRHNDGNPPGQGEVAAALSRTQKVAGPGLTVRELAQVELLVARGRKRAEAGDTAGAWKAWSEVAGIAPRGVYGAEAQREVAAALTRMRADLDAALAALVPGQAARAYARLVELEAAFADTPLEKDACLAVKKAEKQKDVREEIRVYKLEREAEDLWQAAQELFAGGDERRGERTIRRLLRKKYATTPAAARAREKYPEWAAEEAGKGK